MLEYNPAAIDRVRRLAKQGWPHGAVAKMLGWDMTRLQRIAKEHQIRFLVFKAKSKTPDLTKTDIRWDGHKAWHGNKSVRLQPAQSRLFNAMLRFPDYDWNVDKLSATCDIPRNSVSAHLSTLRDNLAVIGLFVTRREYQIVRL